MVNVHGTMQGHSEQQIGGKLQMFTGPIAKYYNLICLCVCTGADGMVGLLG